MCHWKMITTFIPELLHKKNVSIHVVQSIKEFRKYLFKKYIYRISANSFRGNYSFLNLTLCTVTFDHSTYRCGNYSREETIQGRKLYAEIWYMIYWQYLMKVGRRKKQDRKVLYNLLLTRAKD